MKYLCSKTTVFRNIGTTWIKISCVTQQLKRLLKKHLSCDVFLSFLYWRKDIHSSHTKTHNECLYAPAATKKTDVGVKLLRTWFTFSQSLTVSSQTWSTPVSVLSISDSSPTIVTCCCCDSCHTWNIGRGLHRLWAGWQSLVSQCTRRLRQSTFSRNFDKNVLQMLKFYHRCLTNEFVMKS